MKKLVLCLLVFVLLSLSSLFLHPSQTHASQPWECGTGNIDTAIGCIPVGDETSFGEFLIGWGLGIGGGIAFLLIVYAGFIIITSSGNPQKLQAGKELLTAALSGLLLLVFSVFILRLLGQDILGIF